MKVRLTDPRFDGFKNELESNGIPLFPEIAIPPGKAYLYTLGDSLTGNLLKYVGYTTNFKLRYRMHLYEAERGKSYKNRWVAHLASQNALPVMSKWGTSYDIPTVKNKEIALIKQLKDKGYLLTNGTPGGDGVHGYEWSTEQRRQISHALRKPVAEGTTRSTPLIKHTEESVQKIVNANRGEANHQAKLTWNDVEEMRHLLNEEGHTTQEVAKLFGVSTTQTTRIRRNQSWRK